MLAVAGCMCSKMCVLTTGEAGSDSFPRGIVEKGGMPTNYHVSRYPTMFNLNKLFVTEGSPLS